VKRRDFIKAGALWLPATALGAVRYAPHRRKYFQPVASGGGSGASVTDTFDRADANPMTTGMSDGVGVWTSGPGAANDMQIFSNSAYGVGGAYSMARVHSPAFTGNHKSVITLSGTSAIAPAVRCQSDTDPSCYFAYLSSSTVIQIYLQNSSLGVTGIGSSFSFAAVSAGDQIALAIFGSTLTLYINGVSQGTRTDATLINGQPAVWAETNSSPIASFSAVDL